jgi:hypothetical protein
MGAFLVIAEEVRLFQCWIFLKIEDYEGSCLVFG